MQLICPNCKEERDFKEIFFSLTNMPPVRQMILGPGSRGQISKKEIELPLAYCVKCRTVIYIGNEKS